MEAESAFGWCGKFSCPTRGSLKSIAPRTDASGTPQQEEARNAPWRCMAQQDRAFGSLSKVAARGAGVSVAHSPLRALVWWSHNVSAWWAWKSGEIFRDRLQDEHPGRVHIGGQRRFLATQVLGGFPLLGSLGLGSDVHAPQDAAEPKVRQSGLPVGANERVVALDVVVRDVELAEVLEPRCSIVPSNAKGPLASVSNYRLDELSPVGLVEMMCAADLSRRLKVSSVVDLLHEIAQQSHQKVETLAAAASHEVDIISSGALLWPVAVERPDGLVTGTLAFALQTQRSKVKPVYEQI